MLDIKLPSQCVLRNLTTHSDHRGALTEIFRKEWQTGIEPVQWNFVHSQPNVLRGVHVHVLHTDYRRDRCHHKENAGEQTVDMGGRKPSRHQEYAEWR